MAYRGGGGRGRGRGVGEQQQGPAYGRAQRPPPGTGTPRPAARTPAAYDNLAAGPHAGAYQPGTIPALSPAAAPFQPACVSAPPTPTPSTKCAYDNPAATGPPAGAFQDGVVYRALAPSPTPATVTLSPAADPFKPARVSDPPIPTPTSIFNKLFLTETALEPPAAVRRREDPARGLAPEVDHAPVSNSKKGMAHPARPGAGTTGKNVMTRATNFLVNIADNNLFHYDVSINPESKSRQTNREVLAELIKVHGKTSLGGKLPAYDGRKSLYTAGSLTIESEEFSITLVDPEKKDKERAEREYKITIRIAGRTDLYHLQQFLRGRQRDMPQETIQVLDVVLRESPSWNYVTVSRSFFSTTFGHRGDIGEGLECWRGYYQSLRPTQMGLSSLNIDISATSFFKPVTVIQFVQEFLNLRDVSRPLNDRDRVKIKKALRGVRVQTNHQKDQIRRYKITGLTAIPMGQLIFSDERGSRVSVVEYFKQRYDYRLEHTNWPCLQSGSDALPVYLPMEACKIVEGQRCSKKLNDKQVTNILRATCQRPQQREQSIREVSINPESKSRQTNREVLAELIKVHGKTSLGGKLPAYDGRKSLNTAGSLTFESEEFSITLVDPEKKDKERAEREYKITIRIAGRTDLYHLQQFLRGRQRDMPQETIQVLDVVLRESPSWNYVTVSRSFFSTTFGHRGDIGEGLECWRGYYQSLRPTQMGLSLNIDISATSFFKPVTVIQFVQEFLNLRDVSRPLNDRDRVKKDQIRRYKITGLTDIPMSQLIFHVDERGSRVSAVEYFKQRYDYSLEHTCAVSVVQSAHNAHPELHGGSPPAKSEQTAISQKIKPRLIQAMVKVLNDGARPFLFNVQDSIQHVAVTVFKKIGFQFDARISVNRHTTTSSDLLSYFISESEIGCSIYFKGFLLGGVRRRPLQSYLESISSTIFEVVTQPDGVRAPCYPPFLVTLQAECSFIAREIFAVLHDQFHSQHSCPARFTTSHIYYNPRRKRIYFDPTLPTLDYTEEAYFHNFEDMALVLRHNFTYDYLLLLHNSVSLHVPYGQASQPWSPERPRSWRVPPLLDYLIYDLTSRIPNMPIDIEGIHAYLRTHIGFMTSPARLGYMGSQELNTDFLGGEHFLEDLVGLRLPPLPAAPGELPEAPPLPAHAQHTAIPDFKMEANLSPSFALMLDKNWNRKWRPYEFTRIGAKWSCNRNHTYHASDFCEGITAKQAECYSIIVFSGLLYNIRLRTSYPTADVDWMNGPPSLENYPLAVPYDEASLEGINQPWLKNDYTTKELLELTTVARPYI